MIVQMWHWVRFADPDLTLKSLGEGFCKIKTKLHSLELPIRKVTFCNSSGEFYTEWTETLPRSQTFSWGLTETFDANWFKTIGHCRFKNEKLTKFVREKSIPFNFGLFEKLEVIEIDDWDGLQDHWTTITEGIVQVSSPNFKKIAM